jgi:uncharacterized protein YjeT (DUF2065 family)
MLEYWLLAFGLMLVLEGIVPFLLPSVWRATLGKLAVLQDGQVRFIGLTLMLGGLLLIYWMN